jgi:predicted nucleic acid-binding protein
LTATSLPVPCFFPDQSHAKLSTERTKGRLLVSAATVAELNDVLRREKFNKYLPEDERLAFLAALVREAELVECGLRYHGLPGPQGQQVP